MTPRRPLLSFGFRSVLLVVPVAAVLPVACGGYESDTGTGGAAGSPQAGVGGAGGSAQAGVGGSAAGVGGTGGSAQAGTGGTSGAGGAGAQAGTGAASGAGGSAQAGSGAGGSSGSGAGGGAGEGGQGAACEEQAACGGDVVGTWAVQDCSRTLGGNANMQGLGLGCMMAPVTGSLGISGTITFNADGTYMDNTMTAGAATLELPNACLNVSGTTTTCDNVDNALDSIGFAKGGLCVDNAATTGCTCSVTVAQTGGFGVPSFDAAPNGTYKSADNKLTLTAFGIDTLYPYCVSGTTMVLTIESASKTGEATGPIVLQKQ
jgi:hypothetical protein